ncbi:MAG: hypothetical protein KatS3mg087_2038 [Patescibacteria group bacterium]|nr:MAG: hypothetical protein KatS3mg087_2038 [Patescibacteria group bacterium]
MRLSALGNSLGVSCGGWAKRVGPPLRCRPQPARLMMNKVAKAMWPIVIMVPATLLKAKYGCIYMMIFAKGTLGLFSILPCHHPPIDRAVKYNVIPTALHQKCKRISLLLYHSLPVKRGIM